VNIAILIDENDSQITYIPIEINIGCVCLRFKKSDFFLKIFKDFEENLKLFSICL
jgi:hypothetical protein